jgi:hypothetical protein
MKKDGKTNLWDFLIEVLKNYVKHPVRVGILILAVLAFLKVSHL